MDKTMRAVDAYLNTLGTGIDELMGRAQYFYARIAGVVPLAADQVLVFYDSENQELVNTLGLASERNVNADFRFARTLIDMQLVRKQLGAYNTQMLEVFEQTHRTFKQFVIFAGEHSFVMVVK
ncbi:MAG TPA: hypothetical protein VEA59_02315 [Patescibacteria group bacterium]|nr:hypothetical protein [Patescibacteria group bacterium]